MVFDVKKYEKLIENVKIKATFMVFDKYAYFWQ